MSSAALDFNPSEISVSPEKAEQLRENTLTTFQANFREYQDGLDVMTWLSKDHEDTDWVHVNTGAEGGGKSAMSLFMAILLDPDFSLDQIAYTHEQYETLIKELPPNSVIIYDEAHNSFYKRNAMTGQNREAISLLRQHRGRNHFHILNIPDLAEIERLLIKGGTDGRSHSLSRVVKRGWAWFYNQVGIGKISIDQDDKTVNWPPVQRYGFRDGFPDPRTTIPHMWECYDTMKDTDLTGGAEGPSSSEEQISPREAVDEIIENTDYFVTTYNQRRFVDEDLISLEWDHFSKRDTSKVKKGAEKRLGLPEKLND